MKKISCTIAILSLAAAISVCSITVAPARQPNRISIGSFEEMHSYFRYDPERDILISSHRGGMEAGYPENCIESCENTLTHIESFFELDPRLTKDSIIVLMHDKTIDRTTNGTGLVSDYTYEQLGEFRLTDIDGNVTPFRVPTLRDVIEWSRGKTILNLDKKDVPAAMIADLLEETGAVNVMLTVHNPQEALYYLSRNPQSMFSAHIFSVEKFEEYDRAGIPWGQVMAYVGRKLDPRKRELYEALHERGVMYMISVAPTHDKEETPAARLEGYLEEIQNSPDVIETDYPSQFTGLILRKNIQK